MMRLSALIGAAMLACSVPAMAQHEHHTPAPTTALPAPPPPIDHAADRYHDPADMARARKQMRIDHGGGTYSSVLFDLAEVQVRDGRNGYRWAGEGWFGGDINRLAIKTEGEGSFGRRDGHAEIQALYSRALDPYWNVEAGVRHDFRPGSDRSYVTVGIEGLAPYWFEMGGALFLSDKGDVLGRIEASLDQRITQRIILQSRIEANLAAQDVPADRIGAGLSDVELGLRLRYEIRREFAPYVGISHDRKLGRTARYARADGDDPRDTSFVIGIRTWF